MGRFSTETIPATGPCSLDKLALLALPGQEERPAGEKVISIVNPGKVDSVFSTTDGAVRR